MAHGARDFLPWPFRAEAGHIPGKGTEIILVGQNGSLQELRSGGKHIIPHARALRSAPGQAGRSGGILHLGTFAMD